VANFRGYALVKFNLQAKKRKKVNEWNGQTKGEDTEMEIEDTAAGEQNFSTFLSYPR